LERLGNLKPRQLGNYELRKCGESSAAPVNAEIRAKDWVIREEINPEIKQVDMTINAACDWYWKVAGSLRKNAENDLLVVKRIHYCPNVDF
jgi:hypothetical protein